MNISSFISGEDSHQPSEGFHPYSNKEHIHSHSYPANSHGIFASSQEKKVSLPPLTSLSHSTQNSQTTHFSSSLPSSSPTQRNSYDPYNRNRSLGTSSLLPRLLSGLELVQQSDLIYHTVNAYAPHLIKIDEESKRFSFDFSKLDIRTQFQLERMLSDQLARFNPQDYTLYDPSLYTGIVFPWTSPSISEPSRILQHSYPPPPPRSSNPYASSEPYPSHPNLHLNQHSSVYATPIYPDFHPDSRFSRDPYAPPRHVKEEPNRNPYNNTLRINNIVEPSVPSEMFNSKRRTQGGPYDFANLVGVAEREEAEGAPEMRARDLLNSLKRKEPSDDDDESLQNLIKKNNDGGWECGQCYKVFLDKSNLVKHIRLHSDEKPYICKECGRGFRHTGSLKDHLYIHSGLKPYKCDVDGCNKCFSQASNLRRHKRIHTGDKPYVCPHCDKAFNQSSNLKQHVMGHTAGRY